MTKIIYNSVGLPIFYKLLQLLSTTIKYGAIQLLVLCQCRDSEIAPTGKVGNRNSLLQKPLFLIWLLIVLTKHLIGKTSAVLNDTSGEIKPVSRFGDRSYRESRESEFPPTETAIPDLAVDSTDQAPHWQDFCRPQ